MNEAARRDLSDVLGQCGLSRLGPVLEDEELTVLLLRSMQDLPASLSELGIMPADAERLDAALREGAHVRSRLPVTATAGVASFLDRLGLQRYLSVFEDEELTDVALLASMGAELERNLGELGLEVDAIGQIAEALRTPGCKSSVPMASKVPQQMPLMPPDNANGGPAGCRTSDHLDAVFINLATRTDRRAAIEAALSTVQLRAERLDALCGPAVPSSIVAFSWDTTLNAKFDRNCKVDASLSMSDGERGCAASHVELWRRCAASGAPLLIFEDDLEFATPRAGEWARALATAIEGSLEPSERNLILYLGAEAQVRVGAPSLRAKQAIWGARAASTGCELAEALWAWQTHAYVIWPTAARLLLGSLPVDAPADVFMSRHYHEGTLCGLVCQPSLAEQLDPYQGGDIEHSSLRDRERMFAGQMARQASAQKATRARMGL